MPVDFVVPSKDFTWPEETWATKLGENLKTICNNSVFSKYKGQLEVCVCVCERERERERL